MSLGEVCSHGSLKRQCYTCELESSNKRLREVVGWIITEYERGERKGYDATIPSLFYELAKQALNQEVVRKNATRD